MDCFFTIQTVSRHVELIANQVKQKRLYVEDELL